jgi:hypothetical protein
MKNLIAWLTAKFGRTPVAQVAADQHHQAQLDLLEAQAALEHWTAQVQTLKARVRRLEPAPADNGVASVTSIAAGR